MLVIACLLIAEPIYLSSRGHADINSGLQELFDDIGFRTTSTSAGAYEGQTRNFIVGGSISARANNKTAQLFQITPPNLKAGCAGIDLFFGGFSFINAAEFTAFLQAVGQNAIGYAFQAALEGVCPTCNSILKSMRSLATSLNNAAGLDACRVATTFRDKYGIFQAIKDIGSKASFLPQSDDKTKSDPISGWIEGAAKTINDFNEQVYKSAKDDNLNIKARPGIPTSQAINQYNLSEDEAELIVSILGTKAPKGKPKEDGNIECEPYPALLSFRELMDGGTPEKPVLLYYCTSEGGEFSKGNCESIATKTVPNFKGNKARVREWMISIRDKYMSSTPLDDKEKQFISSTPAPPVGRLIESSLQHSPELANIMIESTSDIASVFYTATMLMTYGDMYARGVAKINTCGENNGMERYYQLREMIFQDMSKYSQTIRTQVDFLQFLMALEGRILAMSSEKIKNGITNSW
jgi:conjugative transfer pilus assembly protein TraH